MTSQRKTLPVGVLSVFFVLPVVRTVTAVHLEWCPVVLYPLFQLVMIAIPIVVWVRSGFSGRELRDVVGLKRTNLLRGVLVGVLMGGGIVAGYYALFRPSIDPAPMLDKVRSLGLLEWYWVMAVVMSLWNALFEEYYWRGFLVGQLAGRVGSTLGVCIIGGGMFAVHHLFVVLDLFDLPLAILFTLGTMTAGIVWTWMRRRGGSIWDCYISHVLADLAVFWCGWDLIGRGS